MSDHVDHHGMFPAPGTLGYYPYINNSLIYIILAIFSMTKSTFFYIVFEFCFAFLLDFIVFSRKFIQSLRLPTLNTESVLFFQWLVFQIFQANYSLLSHPSTLFWSSAIRRIRTAVLYNYCSILNYINNKTQLISFLVVQL